METDNKIINNCKKKLLQSWGRSDIKGEYKGPVAEEEHN